MKQITLNFHLKKNVCWTGAPDIKPYVAAISFGPGDSVVPSKLMRNRKHFAISKDENAAKCVKSVIIKKKIQTLICVDCVSKQEAHRPQNSPEAQLSSLFLIHISFYIFIKNPKL